VRYETVSRRGVRLVLGSGGQLKESHGLGNTDRLQRLRAIQAEQ